MKVATFPLVAATRQNVSEAHERDTRNPALKYVGVLQLVPVYSIAAPSPAVAAQNDADRHETELRPSPNSPDSASTVAGAVQELPS